MAELAPTTLLYSQAIALIEQFKADYAAGKFKTTSEISEGIREVITRYNMTAGKPMLKYEPVVKGEPPLSSKSNEVLTNLQADVNLLLDQIDVLKAASIFTHNYITTEVLKLQNHNAQVSNKVKTLQLYSSGTSFNTVTFGDYFANEEFIDKSLTPTDQTTSLMSPGILTLGRSQQSINVIKDANVKVLPTSNGFLGNNQEILDPASATINPATKDKVYTFVSNQSRHADLADIIDGEPNTWVEYENYLVDPQDKARAGGFNFEYSQINSDTNAQEEVVWSDGPENGVLKFGLEFDLQAIKTINNVSYTPFGLHDNVNHPVSVTSIQLSANGTDWDIINPQNVWITTDANLQVSRDADNVTVGTAVWTFSQTEVRYIRIYIEQPRSISVNIGHIYYETASVSNGTNTPGKRVQGPIPPIDEPDKYGTVSGNSSSSNTIQKEEYFVGQRWAIGVRDIEIEELTYNTDSIMVSKKFDVDGVIDRVSLDADVFIPDGFDTGQLWVKFYISPDEGVTWVPISRIKDSVNNVKAIIAFNDPLPSEFQEPEVGYHNTHSTVNSLRLKIELLRPADKQSSSPIVKSYKLKVLKR